MTARPGDRLPRPATGGTWFAEGPVRGFDHTWFVWATGEWPGGEAFPIARMAHGLPATEEAEQYISADARAIAALPAWIEAHDAERARANEATARANEATARAERAEWLLRETARYLTETRATSTDPGVLYTCDALLRDLARHGYGEAGE